MASTTDETPCIELWYAIIIVTSLTIIAYLLLEILILQTQIFQVIDEIPTLMHEIALRLDEIAIEKTINENWYNSLQEKISSVWTLTQFDGHHSDSFTYIHFIFKRSS